VSSDGPSLAPLPTGDNRCMKKGDSLTEIGSLGVICGQLKHVNKQKIGKEN